MKSVAILLTAAALAVSAAPTSRSIIKRDASGNLTDVDILQFALTLEHLEATFYTQAVANFSTSAFVAAGFSNTSYDRIVQIGQHETQHVTLLTGGLSAAGATPVSACTYKFPYTDVKSFLALAQVLEGVGVSAYLGAAASISDKSYLTIAASILTTETRHNEYIRQLNGEDPFPTPEDTPQSPREIISLAGGFFVSCPNGSAPTIQPFPALTATSTNLTAGSHLTLTTTANVTSPAWCAFANGLTVDYMPYTNGSCAIPSGSNVDAGQTYVVLTGSNSSLTDATTIAGPALLDLPSLYSLDSSNTTTGPGLNGQPGISGTNGTSANGTKTNSSASPSASANKTSGAVVPTQVRYGAAFAGLMAFAAFLL